VKSLLILSSAILLLLFGQIVALGKTGDLKLSASVGTEASADSAKFSVPDVPCRVPDTLVAMIMRRDTSRSSQEAIVRLSKHLYFPYREPYEIPEPFLTILSPDLDGDAETEILMQVGRGFQDTHICVFKQIGDRWYLIFIESIHSQYTEPELKVLRCAGLGEIFYTNITLSHGSSIFLESYRFYKIVGQKVVACLEIPKEGHISGWGLFLNERVDIQKIISDTVPGSFRASFAYSFFPGAVYESDIDWEAHEEIPFVSAIDTVTYTWDAAALAFIPIFSGRPNGLTPDKYARLGDFGNDSLFVSAYGYEIQNCLDTGSTEQKRLLTDYLKQFRSTGKAVPPSGELELKTSTGGMNFFGPKDSVKK